ncbi:MAG: serine/threonine protein kinase [Candidatus Loosdrechtia sp.]|uniref:serine/threonine protein kinase n=1 Tax=Candidatus Loosdrechtia sp. TaxID=3101272 RepID=UPI003A7437E8|nr:MAG: protein kinase [Candidatus Jettenia sp. AMX2]
MYRIHKYYFNNFKSKENLHRSNYALLIDMPERGIKYAPDFEFSDEYYLLKGFDHIQIPAAYDFGQGELFKNGKFLIRQNFIILQHIDGCDLVNYFMQKDVTNNKIIEEIIKYFITACDPLSYIHSKNYIHCDLKPGHLILNKKTGLVYIIDFELAIKIGGIMKGISKAYASPEQLQMRVYLRNLPGKISYEDISAPVRLDVRTDLYSLGLILYQILTKRLWQVEKVLPCRINRRIPPELEEIMIGLLEPDVSLRLSSAGELKKELNCII